MVSLLFMVVWIELTSRYLHRRRIRFAQCSSQGRLDRRSLHHRRDLCPRTRDPPRTPAPRNSSRQVSPPSSLPFLPSYPYIVNDAKRLTLRFVSITPLYAPTSPGTDENIFITKSYDATSHFETVVEDVFDVWQRVKGEPLVLKKREVEVEA
jgi:hypothetical protein